MTTLSPEQRQAIESNGHLAIDDGAYVVVNALPPLKVVQFLGNACLSPTTLAPKGPFDPVDPSGSCGFLSTPSSRTG